MIEELTNGCVRFCPSKTNRSCELRNRTRRYIIIALPDPPDTDRHRQDLTINALVPYTNNED